MFINLFATNKIFTSDRTLSSHFLLVSMSVCHTNQIIRSLDWKKIRFFKKII